ncbi:hypothetical protein [Phytohabitans rumicis]|uniref:hypothetical protein n=1 Tax=Phytohabitans rumicis TaxID=1076125 RepID=UPI0031E74DCA
MLMLKTTFLPALAGLVLAGVVAAAAPAHADGGIGGVDCSENSTTAECGLHAGTPAQAGSPNDNGSGNQSGGSGEPTRCRYERVQPQLPPPAGAGPGAWYVRACEREAGGVSQTQPMWLTDPPAPDPSVLAQDAVSRLHLPAPGIHTNPDAAQADVLVWVPVWLWVDGLSWASRSATAAVPGMSVTATATAKKAVWRLGDGAVQACGQGSVWRPGTDPRAASPTCGYTYDRAGVMTVTVTVTWAVAWRGGGQAGTVPDLTTTANLPLRVVEAPALNTAGGR